MIAVHGSVVGLRRAGLDGLDIGVAFRGGTPDAPLEVNLVGESGFRLVHFKMRPEAGDAVLDWEGPEGWGGRPISVRARVDPDHVSVLRIRAASPEADSAGRALTVELDGELLGTAPVDANVRPAHIGSNFPDTSVADFSVGSADGLRWFAAPGGLRGPELGVRPGLTAVVHVESPAPHLRRVLKSVAEHVAEIVLINECRDPAAAEVAAAFRQDSKILRSFDGPAVPIPPRADLRLRSSRPPPALSSRSAAALPHVWTGAVLLWSPDRIALPDAFEALLDQFDLRTRSDAFALWAGGVPVFEAGGRLFADVEVGCGGWIASSRAWNGEWDLDEHGQPCPDPAYLGRALQLSSAAPAFVRIIPLAPENRERTSTSERGGALLSALRSGSPPPSGFVELPDLAPDTLRRLLLEASGPPEPVPSRHRPPEPQTRTPRLGVFCISHKGAPHRQAVIRTGWAAELTRLGVPVYFVVGDHPAPRPSLHGDVLHTPARDGYEHLPAKILEMVRYAHGQDFDHLIKVDDDCVLNPATLLQRAFAEHEYCGGMLATADRFQPGWHAGKCGNSQLDAFSVNLGGLEAWFAGGAGYALGRGAMSRILDAAAQVRSELLEDVAVGRALAADGMTASTEHRILSCLHFSRLPDLPREHEPVDIVWDVPASELAAVHAALRAQDWSRAAVEPWAAMLGQDIARPGLEP